MSAEERRQLRDVMRKKYAVHHTEAGARAPPEPLAAASEPDTGEPMPWN